MTTLRCPCEPRSATLWAVTSTLDTHDDLALVLVRCFDVWLCWALNGGDGDVHRSDDADVVRVSAVRVACKGAPQTAKSCAALRVCEAVVQWRALSVMVGSLCTMVATVGPAT